MAADPVLTTGMDGEVIVETVSEAVVAAAAAVISEAEVTTAIIDREEEEVMNENLIFLKI